MANVNPAYMSFYLEGRDAKLFRHGVDEEDLAKKILETGGDVHQTIHAAVTTEAAALIRQKKAWLRESAEFITECGGSEDDAWSAFVAGRVDELVHAIEPNVVEIMTEECDGGEDDGEEDDDDADDEEDDEDDTDDKEDK